MAEKITQQIVNKIYGEEVDESVPCERCGYRDGWKIPDHGTVCGERDACSQRAARREGVIEGLKRALQMAIEAYSAYDDPIDDIRAEIERLKAEG